jgi:hypothetical protein
MISPDSEDQDWLKQTRVKNELIYYGERGVVNSLLNSLTRRNQMRSFLSLIDWADEIKREDMFLPVESSKTIVEVGLNEFGDPDMIIITEDVEGEKKFIFLEAKVGSYTENAINNQLGMITGYNSKINGQLSLKYRFAKALESVAENSIEIKESTEILRAYQDKLRDEIAHPRTLKHQSIIEKIIIPSGLHMATPENSYFIAMTVEDEDYNPFTDADNKEYLPVFLDEEGDNIWDELNSHVGLINLEKVKKLGLGEKFDEVLDIMVKSSKERSPCEYPRLRTVRLIHIPDEEVDVCRNIGSYLEETLSGYSLQQQTGSFSLIDETGLVAAKIIPRNGEIWFGVRDSKEISKDFIDKDKWCIVNTPFQFYKLEENVLKKQGQKLLELLS